MASTLSASTVALALLAIVSSLVGCASRPHASTEPAPAPMHGRWARWSAPSFSIIDRETFVALTHSPDRNALLVEQGPGAAGHTWIISLPETLSMSGPIELTDSSPARAWLMAPVDNGPVTALTAHGRVSVLAADADSMTAQVNIVAFGPPPTAGRPAPRGYALDGRITFDRFTPVTADPLEPTTTSSLPTPPPKEKRKRRSL